MTTPLLSLALALLPGCTGDKVAEVSRAQVLADTVQIAILPGHAELGAAAAGMEAAAINFCTAPDSAGFDAARAALVTLRRETRTVGAWGFGPARNFGIELEKNLDKTPEEGTAIEAVIAGSEDITAEYLSSLDYRDRVVGHAAIGWLLFSQGDDTLSLYTAGDDAATRRCAYLNAAATHARGIVDSYVAAWDPADGDYAGQLTTAGSGSDAYPSEQEALTALVSGMLSRVDRMATFGLAAPLGSETGGTAVPTEAEAWVSDQSVALLQGDLAGLRLLYDLGGAGSSLSAYIVSRQAEGQVDAAVQAAFSGLDSALAAIPEPMDETVVSSPETVQAALDATEALAIVLSGDLSTLLGINPTSVEGDND